MKPLLISIISVVTLLLAFACVDCSSGATKHYDCRITGRHYVAAWTETEVSTDSDGNISTSVIRHPEEFHLYCEDLEEATRVIDVNTSSSLYNTITNGECVIVKVRQGKWTGINWMPCIVGSR